MVEDDGGATFPVVFYDGERESNMGSVRVHSSQNFKNFQSGLSQRIGISPNQITVYLMDRKKPKTSTEVRRKFPITSKVNFAVLVKEIDCFFLVVLKRTRKNRRAKAKQALPEFGDYFPQNRMSPSDNFLLLRRNQMEFADYNDRIRDLQIQRANYAMMMNFDGSSSFFAGLNSPYRRIEERLNEFPMEITDKACCEECEHASREGITAQFHWCVRDAVVLGFRSPAGPIAPPRKAEN